MKMKIVKMCAISVYLLISVAASARAQTCPQPFTLRQESCPSGASTCSSKGSTLTYQELDRDLINAIALCNGPGQFTWPAPSAGTLTSDSSGNITITAGGGGGAPTTSQYLLLSNDATTSAERVFTPGLGLTAADGGANSTYTLSFKTSDTLSGNPSLSSEQTVFTTDGTGGGLLFEGSAADSIEGILIWDPATSDKTLTLPNETGTLCSTGSVCSGYAAGTAGVANSATTLAANGSNCSAGQWAAGGDASGNAEGCTADDDTPESGDFTNLTGGAGITNTAGTLATASNETGFLTSGALTCGASTAGKIQVHTTPIQYCDNSATPTLRYSAYGESNGIAYSALKEINIAGPPNAAACDGVTDDTSAIQAKIDNAADDSTLRLPPGTCITSQLNLTAAKDLRILGSGPRKSVLKAKSGSTGVIINISPAARQDYDIGEFSIDLTDAATINGIKVDHAEPIKLHDIRIELGAIGIVISNTGNSYFDRIRTWNQTTAGIQIDGDTSAELHFSDIDIQRNVAGTMAAGFEVVRSLSADGGAYYLSKVRITRAAGTITHGFYFNESGGSINNNPVFMSQCVADNINGGSAARFLKQGEATIINSWFNNTEPTTNSAIDIDGGSDFRVIGNVINGSTTGSCVGFTNAPVRLNFSSNTCVAGTAFDMPASSPPTGLFLAGNNVTNASALTDDLAKLTAAGNGITSYSGMRVLTDEVGPNRTFSMSDGVNGHIRWQRINSTADWQFLNEAFNTITGSLSDAGVWSTSGGMIVGDSTGNDSLSFNEEATNPTCAAGDYRIWANSADTKLKKCQNGTITDLDTVSGGGASNSFETLNAPSGTDPVADSSTDTLNMTCSGGLTCTGNSTTDTIDLVIGTAPALAANGSNCGANQWAAGVDASGISEGCTTDDDVPESGDFTNLTAGRSLTIAAGTIDADAELYETTKCMMIENPVSGDDFLFYRAERAATVTGIDCLVVGGTSVATLVKECDTAGATCGNTEASITCGTTNTTESGGIDDSAWDAGDWIRIDPGTVTGSVTQLSVCVTFQVAD